MTHTINQTGSDFSVEKFKELHAAFVEAHDDILRQQLQGVSVKHLIPFHEKRAESLHTLLLYVKMHLPRIMELAEKGVAYEGLHD